MAAKSQSLRPDREVFDEDYAGQQGGDDAGSLADAQQFHR